MTKVRLEIVSPERSLLSTEAEMAVIPGEAGNFGVLYGHSNLISAIKPGVVEVYDSNSIVAKFIVSRGFSEVNQTTCTILTDEALKVGEIDFAKLESRLEKLQVKLIDAVGNLKDELLSEINFIEKALSFKAAA